MTQTKKWLVPGPQKLVSFLQFQLGAEYSGKLLRRVLEANLCRVNGRVERFGSSVLKGGEVIELSPSWKSVCTTKLPKKKIEILFEDEWFQIVNKPVDWVCTDAEALRSLGAQRYLVHRLDKDTTGLLLVAKSPRVRDQLMELFEKREIKKSYLALVDGIPREQKGVQSSLLAKKGSFQGQTIWGSCGKGLTAVTHWQQVGCGNKAALLLCEPLTGRTHQIRVHLAEMGHPILVDRQYAKTFRCSLFIQRPLLHAYRLQFVHPMTGQSIDIKASIPADMREALVGVQMGHLGEFATEKEQNHCRNQRHNDKNAEKIEEPAHFLHESSK